MADTYAYLHGGNLYINLTNRCCNDCTFCIRKNADGIEGYKLWIKQEPEAAKVIETASGFAKESYGEAVFCGYGEPVIRLSVMLKICEYFHSIGKKTRLNTNGLGNLIHGRDITGELKGKIDSVSVSLNDSTPKDYQTVSRSRYGEAAFPALIEFTRLCASVGIKTYMTVVDVISPEHIEKCREIALSAGAELRVRKHITDNENYA